MTAGKPVGRPLKFETVEELETQINLYFDDCDKREDTRVWSHDEIIEQEGKRVCTNCWQGERTKGCLLVSGYLKLPRPYTVTGLAVWLDTSRQTLLNYEMRSEFFDTIARAKQRIENYAEEKLFDMKTPTRGVIFSLSNNSDGWTEKTQQTVVPGDPVQDLTNKLFDQATKNGQTVPMPDDTTTTGTCEAPATDVAPDAPQTDTPVDQPATDAPADPTADANPTPAADAPATDAPAADAPDAEKAALEQIEETAKEALGE